MGCAEALAKKVNPMRILFLIIVLTQGSSIGEELPREAEILLEKRQTAMERINERLNEELEKIKADRMGAGDLEGAKAVDALIADSDKTVKNDSADPIVGTTWNYLGVNRQKINEFTFLKGGKVRCESSYNDANWRRLDSSTILFGYTSEGGYVVLYSDGNKNFMTGLHKGRRTRSIQRIK